MVPRMIGFGVALQRFERQLQLRFDPAQRLGATCS